MHWGIYETCSVFSGIIMVIAGLFVADESVRGRATSVLAGIGYIGYGVYVANQTSGTYVFPVVIFILPVLALIYLIGKAVVSSHEARNPEE